MEQPKSKFHKFKQRQHSRAISTGWRPLKPNEQHKWGDHYPAGSNWSNVSGWAQGAAEWRWAYELSWVTSGYENDEK